MNQPALTATLLSASLLVACGGPDEEVAYDLDTSGLAQSETTVHDGSETCSPSGPYLSCVALEGVSHQNTDGRGRLHFVFNGTRTQRLVLGGTTVTEVSTSERRNYMSDGAGIVRMHLKSCVDFNGGLTTIRFESQIANGEVIRSESVLTDGC
ncbi:MAG: hypothetical protein RMA76_05305 [Deltaproteobacteria bacterium]|jgi:hypothetical protein